MAERIEDEGRLAGAVKEKRPKASDIDDERFLAAVLLTFEERNSWATRGDVEDRLPPFPSKVVLAKAGQLIKRGLLSGCTCGCRGDFELTADGMTFLKSRGYSRGRLKTYSRSRAIPMNTGTPSKAERSEVDNPNSFVQGDSDG